MSIVSLWKPDSFRRAEIANHFPIIIGYNQLKYKRNNKYLYFFYFDYVIFDLYLLFHQSIQNDALLAPCFIMPKNLRAIGAQLSNSSKVARTCNHKCGDIEWYNNFRCSLVYKSNFSHPTPQRCWCLNTDKNVFDGRIDSFGQKRMNMQ